MTNKTDNRNYLVSVVTPFHNVDMDMFLRAKESVENQTIGFENIQWIIVLHNCEPQYHTEVPELFKGKGNVIIPVLDNEAKTPSSPRNYGVAMATAPYIAYLDGDDQLTPDALSVAVCEMDETEADVLCFRREYELQREGLSVLTETVLWNQTVPKIVVEKGNWDTEKMFNGIFGMVTSKMFRLDFLRRNDITFSETIPFAEDVEYVIRTFAVAEKICYLPQHIGYRYFINEGSLVQNGDKDGKTLIAYAKGMAEIFGLFEKYGIISDCVHGLCMQEALFILRSKSITLEERREIQDILGEYVMNLTPLSPSKILDEESCRLMYNIPREVILNPDDPYHGKYVCGMMNGFSVLAGILSRNRGTDIGRHCSFDTIRTLDAYQFRVPLSDEKSIRPLVALQTNVNETNILTAEKAAYYFRKKTGALLPCTTKHLKQYMDALSDTLSCKKSLFIAYSTSECSITNDAVLAADKEYIILKEFFQNYLPVHPNSNIRLTSKEMIYFQKEKESVFDAVWKDALLDDTFEQIVAFDTKQLLCAFQYLEKNWKDIVSEVKKSDADRGAEIEAVFADGFETPIVPKLWKQALRFVAFGAGELYESTTALKRYLGEIHHNNGYYYTEEAVIGKAKEDNSNVFHHSVYSCFFEVLPLGAEDGEALPLSEADPDTPYQLVVTNEAGLYRYVMDHFIYVKEVGVDGISFTVY